MMTLKWVFSTQAPYATILIRLMVGAVFLSEGIQKFLFPEIVGAGPWSLDARLAGRDGEGR